MNYKIILLLFAFNLMSGCKDTKNGYIPDTSPKTESGNKGEVHKVFVKEFEKAGGYLYVKVSENEVEYWMAIPDSNIEIGETYYYEGGAKMTNFKSNELNKTFDEVIFVQGLRNKATKNNEKATDKNIELISQPQGGISIKDLLENASGYSGKEIMVKGKVVKVNNDILDKNWVHISDGTAFDGKTRLTFTTKEVVNLGDIVSFKGVVALDKDFGYGYVYPVLIEESVLLK